MIRQRLKSLFLGFLIYFSFMACTSEEREKKVEVARPHTPIVANPEKTGELKDPTIDREKQSDQPFDSDNLGDVDDLTDRQDSCVTLPVPFPEAISQNQFTAWNPGLLQSGLDLKISTAFKEAFFSPSDHDDCGLNPVEQMMKEWNKLSHYTFFQIPSGEIENKEFRKDAFDYLNDDTMGIYLLNDWYSGEEYENVLAVTVTSYHKLNNKLRSGDIIFNGTKLFTLNLTSSKDQYDFFTVLLHELGHFLGLRHSDKRAYSVMNPLLSWKDRRRVPTQLDQANLNGLYPIEEANSSEISGTLGLSSPPSPKTPLDSDWVEEERDGLVYRKIYLRDDGRCFHYEKGKLLGEHQLFEKSLILKN